MQRVVVLGMAAGGKSTLSRRISAALNLPLFQIDKIAFKADWSMVEEECFFKNHHEFIAGERWIIDGIDPFSSEAQGLRCDLADTLILIDMPLWRHWWWAFKRNVKLLFRDNPNMPAGCPQMPNVEIFKIIRETRRWNLGMLRKLLEDRPTKACFVLRSPADIRQFCREHIPSEALKKA